MREYWLVAALFEERESQMMGFVLGPEGPKEIEMPPMKAWQTEQYETEEQARASAASLQAAAAAVCTCGNCPKVLAARIIHVFDDEVPVAEDQGRAEKATPEPDWWGEINK